MRKALLAIIGIGCAAAAFIGAQTTPATVNIQLVALVRPGPAIGTVTFYANGVPIASTPEHGGMCNVAVPMQPGTYQLQAQFVSSAAIYGNSNSEVISYTVDPNNPSVVFGL